MLRHYNYKRLLWHISTKFLGEIKKFLLLKRRWTTEIMQSQVVPRGHSPSIVGSSNIIASSRMSRLMCHTCKSSKRCIWMLLLCPLSQTYHSRLKMPKRGRGVSMRGTTRNLSSGMIMHRISTVLWSLSPQCLRYLTQKSLVREGESKETKISG